MKPILLAVTGMSPAVITETLWALRQAGKVWPEEIHVITTAMGKKTLMQSLPDALASLVQEWKTPPLPLREEFIHVVPGENGRPVDDARSREDQEALGDFIIAKVAELTSDPKTCIHASIAGGRKTMTFYLGYAMSLFGRIQDELSHVLVSDPRVEGLPDFFYPSFNSRRLTSRGASEPDMDAKDITIMLADIPFARQRSILPEATLELMKNGQLRFRELINLINLGMDSSRIRLRFSTPTCSLEVGDVLGNLHQKVDFPPLLFSFYHMVAESTLGEGIEICRPGKNLPDKGMAKILLGNLLHLYGTLGLPVPLENGALSIAERIGLIKSLATGNVDDDLVQRLGLHDKFFSNLDKLEEGITPSLFDGYRNQIAERLKRSLPANLVSVIEPVQMFDEHGERVEVRSKRAVAYGINLALGQIRVE